MNVRVALTTSSLLLLFSGCTASPPPEAPPSEPPPSTPPPSEAPPTDLPPGGGPPRASLSAEQCEAQGGTVVGDIGDGATQRPDYVCPAGGAPLGNIAAPAGGPVAIEGSVCCPNAGASSPPEAPTGTPSTDPAIPDTWRTCKADTECALVEIACCDHCNGGKAVAVNKSHVQDASKLRPKCGPTACTKRGCITRAACQNSACVMVSGP